MRTIHTDDITATVRNLCIQACHILGPDVINQIKKALQVETSPTGRMALEMIVQNAEIAAKDHIPLCQDTGMAVVFLEIGQDVHITGGSLQDAINEGVRRGYEDGYLRKSTLDPITRKNLGDNTPAVIHTEIIPGDQFKIVFAPKGFGSENMSRVMMFPPSAGLEGVKDFIIQRVIESGGNPCPPIVVGVGLGGDFEKSALIAKKALLRPLGTQNPDHALNALEKELLQKINATGIGPMGLGGNTTALAVHINSYPTHLASLPVAVNIQCHSCRHSEATI
ncbi:MAG: fumarate hydratase [Desulfomonilaceae bacterium]